MPFEFWKIVPLRNWIHKLNTELLPFATNFRVTTFWMAFFWYHTHSRTYMFSLFIFAIYLFVHSLAKKETPFTTRYIDVNISQWFSDFELHHLLLKCVYIPHSLFNFNRKCKHVKLKVKYFLCSFHCSSLFLYFFFWGKSTSYSPLLVCCVFFL